MGKKFEDHVEAGGCGCWFPEGRMNPDPDAGLLTFRKGGFNIVTKIDCEVWCVAIKGCDQCWPRKDAMGGKPSNMYVRCFKVCDSSFAHLANAEDKALTMANETQKLMQAGLNSMGPQDALLR